MPRLVGIICLCGAVGKSGLREVGTASEDEAHEFAWKSSGVGGFSRPVKSVSQNSKKNWGAWRVETLKEGWGEIYWNWADWLPWIGIQVLFCATVGAVIQWWFKKGLATFLILLTFSLASTFHRLPKPAFSREDIARLNADLPKVDGGVALESISFAHRVFTYNYSSEYPLEGIVAELNKADPLAEYCDVFGRGLSTQQIKRVDFIYVHPSGEEKRTLTVADCPADGGKQPAGS